MNKYLLLSCCVLTSLLSTVRSQNLTNYIGSPAGGNATEIPVQLRQTSINALLIREITENNYGASVSKLTASILPVNSKLAAMTTEMNQNVGPSMIKSFAAVNQGIFLKHNGWPKGEKLTVGFADKHGGKDGPSAALAYSLLLESAITGKKLRDDLACTGDMNSDRTVQPIGGVVDKIRAAKKEGCNIVLIPEKNLPAVMDAAIDGEIELLTSIQIISVKDLDQALQVAFVDNDEKIANEGVFLIIIHKGISAIQAKYHKLKGAVLNPMIMPLKRAILILVNIKFLSWEKCSGFFILKVNITIHDFETNFLNLINFGSLIRLLPKILIEEWKVILLFLLEWEKDYHNGDLIDE